MSDIIDQISEGKKVTCPYTTCDSVFEDLNPDVAMALRNNHIRRHHPNEEE